MPSIGVIGSGKIGSTVARLAVAAGYDVVLSNSGSPETFAEIVARLGPRARPATASEAAAVGELVVVSIPFNAYRKVPVKPLSGKTVIDTSNYYPQRHGHLPKLDNESTSASRLLQQHLPTSNIVKAFSNIFFRHLAELTRPADAADRSALPIAGDDVATLVAVAEFLDRIGYDVVDAGPLAEDWRFRPATPAYVLPYAGGQEEFWAAAGDPVNEEKLYDLLAAADEQPGTTAGRLPERDGSRTTSERLRSRQFINRRSR